MKYLLKFYMAIFAAFLSISSNAQCVGYDFDSLDSIEIRRGITDSLKIEVPDSLTVTYVFDDRYIEYFGEDAYLMVYKIPLHQNEFQLLIDATNECRETILFTKWIYILPPCNSVSAYFPLSSNVCQYDSITYLNGNYFGDGVTFDLDSNLIFDPSIILGNQGVLELEYEDACGNFVVDSLNFTMIDCECVPVHAEFQVSSQVCQYDSITYLNGNYFGDGVRFDSDSNLIFDPSLVSGNEGILELEYDDACGNTIIDSLIFTMINCASVECIKNRVQPIEKIICMDSTVSQRVLVVVDRDYEWRGNVTFGAYFNLIAISYQYGISGEKTVVLEDECGVSYEVTDRIIYQYCDDSCTSTYKTIPISSEVCKYDSITPLDGYYFGDGITYDTDSNSFFDPSLVSDYYGVIETLYNDGCGNTIYDTLSFNMIDCDSAECVPEPSIFPVSSEVCRFDSVTYLYGDYFGGGVTFDSDSNLIFDPIFISNDISLLQLEFLNSCGEMDVDSLWITMIDCDSADCVPEPIQQGLKQIYMSSLITSQYALDLEYDWTGFYEETHTGQKIYSPSRDVLKEGVVGIKMAYEENSCGDSVLINDTLDLNFDSGVNCVDNVSKVVVPKQVCRTSPSFTLNNVSSGDGVVKNDNGTYSFISSMVKGATGFIETFAKTKCGLIEYDSLTFTMIDCDTNCVSIRHSVPLADEICIRTDKDVVFTSYAEGDGVQGSQDNRFFNPSILPLNQEKGVVRIWYENDCGMTKNEMKTIQFIDCSLDTCVPKVPDFNLPDTVCTDEIAVIFKNGFYSIDGKYKTIIRPKLYSPNTTIPIHIYYDNSCYEMESLNHTIFISGCGKDSCTPSYLQIPLENEICTNDSITPLNGYYEGDGIVYDADSNSFFDPSTVSSEIGSLYTWYNDGCGNSVLDSLMFTMIDCELEDSCLSEIVELPKQVCQNFPSILLNPDTTDNVYYFGDGIVYKNGYSLFYSSNLPLNYDAFIIAERFNQCTNVYEIDTIITRIVDCSDSVSAIGETEEIEVKLSPNPVIDYLNISSELNFETYTIYSMSGEIVLEGEIYSESIEMAELKKGSYILMLQSENQIIRKVIVKD